MFKTAPHYPDPVESLRHHSEYYDFYRQNDGSEKLSQFAHWVLGFTCKPNNRFLGNSEGQVDDHRSADGNFLLAIGHSDALDITAGAASLRQSRVLKPLIKTFDVYAKEPLHHIGEDDLLPENHPLASIANSDLAGRVVNKFVRTVFDNYVALRTFRTGDYEDYLAGIESEEERTMMEGLIDVWVKSAGTELSDESVRRLDRRRSEIIFPEGTRRDDFANVLPLRPGIAKMAEGVADPGRLMVLPMAIDHGPDLANKSTPDAIFGELIAIDRSQPREAFLEVVHGGMQECVDNTPTMLALAA